MGGHLEENLVARARAQCPWTAGILPLVMFWANWLSRIILLRLWLQLNLAALQRWWLSKDQS